MTKVTDAFIMFILLFVYCFIETSIAANKNEFSLEKMFNFLRVDDDRLVRYNLPSKEAKMMQKTACEMDLEEVLTLFVSRNVTDEEQKQATFIIASCSIENLRNRNKIGSFDKGAALNKLIEMLDVVQNTAKQSSVDGAASAAEAIWILSFDNAQNHKYFLSRGAIPSLSKLVQFENRNLSIQLAKMWAAAALQNLAASYCKTMSGLCFWDYDGNNGGLHLLPQSPLRDELGHEGRGIMLKDSDLVVYLKRGVCKGPISTKPWASEATYTDNVSSNDHIATWAYVGVIKNLALSEKGTDLFGEMNGCLCDLLNSQDWLESSKAEDALIRLGMEGSCLPQYYKNCKDIDNWKNDLGETCAMYAENDDWCNEFGHFTSRDGVSASEACCCCKGGEEIVSDQHPVNEGEL